MSELSVRQFLQKRGADPGKGIKWLATARKVKSLRRLMNWQTAIVLGGGGAKGDFQVGAVQYLYERGITPQIICGTSVGAINGVSLAEGDGGLDKLKNTWLKLNCNDDMYLPEDWFKNISPELQDTAKQLYLLFNTTLAAIGLEVLAYNSPMNIFGNIILYIKNIETLSKIQHIYDAIQTAKSLYNLDPIERLMRFDSDSKIYPIKIKNSGIKLRLAVVGLESGELRYVDESGMLTGTGKVDLVDAVLASAANPGIFRAKKLGNEYYIDGGVRQTIPIQSAVDLGADEIYAISCSKAKVDPADSFDNKKILDIAERTISIVSNEIEENSLHPPRGWGIDPTIIRPDFEIHDGETIDPGLIRIQIAYGYFRADDAIGRIPLDKQGQVKDLTKNIIQLRKDIWDLEPTASDIKYNNETHTQSIPDADALRNVRIKKRQLKDWVEQRQLLGGSTPDKVDTWWKQWERHSNWNPIIPTPWDRMVTRNDVVDAESPP